MHFVEGECLIRPQNLQNSLYVTYHKSLIREGMLCNSRSRLISFPALLKASLKRGYSNVAASAAASLTEASTSSLIGMSSLGSLQRGRVLNMTFTGDFIGYPAFFSFRPSAGLI